MAAESRARAAENLVLIPGDFKLSGALARQQLIVERSNGGHNTGQVTNGLAFKVSDTNVVKLVDGVALPMGNGIATIQARVSGLTAVSRVVVSDLEKPMEWSFRNHVQPVLAKMGCSSGACHGAAAGKNGFKLSLRGYDDNGDYLAITRNALGRRIVLSDPGRSLVLLKPTTAVPHKGGQRFATNSLEYRVLSEWIAAGAPGPRESDSRIERLEVLPAQAVLKPSDTQQLIVRARFTDGRVEDVTRWVKFTSANSAVATVDDNGAVQVIGHGEGAITAWYLSRIAIATVTVPFQQKLPRDAFAEFKPRNFIDHLVLDKLRSLNLPPSGEATDSEFLRRAFIDTVGTLPTIHETSAFLADHSPGKRDRLIETLLKRPEFVDYWTYKWSDLLLVQSRALKPAAMWAYYGWIRSSVATNAPWNTFVRRIVTAQGSSLENGAANFFVLHDDPRLMSETTSQAFLGMSINCAKCHNHPMEKWTNDQYYKMANLFARVRAKTGRADGEEVIFCSADGDLAQPLTGRPQTPTPLDGAPVPIESPDDRRVALADWLVARENPYFSRDIANRVWANFFGVCLVENVDDLRATNPASNEQLLSAAAGYLADHQFDLQALMRAILQSATYQRSSRARPENAADQRYYSHYYPRRMMAEVLLDVLSEATGAPTQFKGYPAGWRALQLPDSNVDSYFLKSFGRPDRDRTCECERSGEPSVAQILHLSNGDTLNQKLSLKNNRLGQELDAQARPDKIVDDAYLAALCRHPTAVENEKIQKLLQGADATNLRPAVEDVYWGILSSKEFLFNH